MEHGRRATVFGEVADAYERLRPGYPPEVVDLLVAGDPDLVVDVGCGTGKAARLVADRGVEVLGVEPDARMAEIARSHGLRVEVTPFEAWTPTPCDVLYAAQAWHWVDPDAGAAKAADALRPGGRWAAFWNREDGPEVQERLDEVYRRLAPHLVGEHPIGSDAEMEDGIAAALQAHGAFGSIDHVIVDWSEELTATDLVDRRLTHSVFRLLDADLRAALRVEMVDSLGDPAGTVAQPYRSYVLLAERR